MNNRILLWRKSSKLLSGLVIACSLILSSAGVAFAQTAPQIKIYGRISDQVSGLPVSGAYVDLRKTDGSPLANFSTQSDGYYEFVVSPRANSTSASRFGPIVVAIYSHGTYPLGQS